jgi:hypothetical protein
MEHFNFEAPQGMPVVAAGPPRYLSEPQRTQRKLTEFAFYFFAFFAVQIPSYEQKKGGLISTLNCAFDIEGSRIKIAPTDERGSNADEE